MKSYYHNSNFSNNFFKSNSFETVRENNVSNQNHVSMSHNIMYQSNYSNIPNPAPTLIGHSCGQCPVGPYSSGIFSSKNR